MISAILEGYLVGLSLVVLIGPVFFVLLHATLEQGKQGGLMVALGIFVSDVIIVYACDCWGGELVSNSSVTRWFSFIGALVTAGLGIRYWRSPPLNLLEAPQLQSGGLFSLFSSGFAVNFINPFVFFVWLGIISFARHEYPIRLNQIVFLSACIAGILTLDLLKVIGAQWLRNILNPLWLRKILRGAGLILLLLSLRLIYALYAVSSL